MSTERGIGSLVRSIILLILGVGWTGYMAFNAVVFSYISPGENKSHKVARLWARCLLILTSVRVQVIGGENILEGKPQVYMVNHQSVFDIFVLLANVPGQFRWIIKKELFAVPVFGHALRAAGYIKIDRGNHEKALRSLDDAAAKIRDGKSVMTFPEGTRSKDGTIKPFKQGMFHLAMQSGVPIVPISIVGTAEIMPKHSLKIFPKRVTMIIDKPVDVSQYSIETRHELIERVRNTIVENFEKTAAPLTGEEGSD